MNTKSELMNAADMQRALKRIAHQIIELITVRTNRLARNKAQRRSLAHALAENIKAIEGVSVPVGELDITLYRDDLSEIQSDPVVSGSDVPFGINGMDVVLVDDVLYTGRTARAALDATSACGRAGKHTACRTH